MKKTHLLLLFIITCLFTSGCGSIISKEDSPVAQPGTETEQNDDTVPGNGPDSNDTPPPSEDTTPNATVPSDNATPSADPTIAQGPTLPHLNWNIGTFYTAHGGYNNDEKAAINELLRRLKIIIASDEFEAALDAHYARSQLNDDLRYRLVELPSEVLDDIKNETRTLNFGKFSNVERKAAGKAPKSGLGSINGNWIGFPVEYGDLKVSSGRAKTLFHEIMHNMGYKHESGVPNIGNYVVQALYKEFDDEGRFDNDFFN